MSLKNIFSKRRQIRAAWDQKKIPSEYLIREILEDTVSITPSKQNLFPYKIHVFGPSNKNEKENIAQICKLYKTGSVQHWDNQDNGTFLSYDGYIDINQYILDDEGNDIRIPPWVLVFEQRLAEPNNFVKDYSKLHNDWSRFTQTDPNRFRELCNTKLTCIEIGMFIQTLAGLCLEKDLGISYIRSFPEWQWKKDHYNKEKNKEGKDWFSLPQITEAPLMICQIGYVADVNDFFQSNSVDPNQIRWENKPGVDEIIKFHSAGKK